jgi:beta-glucosidase/6-phospho-beta-glucosidase/beta-galactosidase
MFTFAFATGIEGSAPTIEGGRVRMDEMEACGFYENWRTDFDLVKELGLDFLRYGPPLHRTWTGPGRHDWDFADETFPELRRRNIVPIVDLCHFGLPDWLGNFQNPDFPELFARYAGAFAARFPWVQLYTPVNEMFICAVFSARRGWWNEQLKSERAFVTALKHLVKANVLAMEAILRVRPDALFIQSESSEYYHPESPEAVRYTHAYNAGRFLTLDLNYGRQVEAPTYQYLRDNGMTAEEYDWFMYNTLRRHCVMGNDYYASNEHWVWSDGTVEEAGEVFGYCEITRQYHARYNLPVMHTETNRDEGPDRDDAVRWLWKQWANVLRIRNSGVPVLGFTWYSLTDQVDWHVSLRERHGHANPRGLYDLSRNPRAVGRAYRKLVADWKPVLAAQSACLTLPVTLPAALDAIDPPPAHAAAGAEPSLGQLED